MGSLVLAASGLFYPTGSSPFDPTSLYSAGGNLSVGEFADLTGQNNQKKLLQVATVDYVNTAGGLNAYGDPLVNGQTTGSASSNASSTLDLSQFPNMEYYIGVGGNATGTGSTIINLSTTFGGKLYEIVEYDRILSTAERQQVEVYLSGKWGLT